VVGALEDFGVLLDLGPRVVGALEDFGVLLDLGPRVVGALEDFGVLLDLGVLEDLAFLPALARLAFMLLLWLTATEEPETTMMRRAVEAMRMSLLRLLLK